MPSVNVATAKESSITISGSLIKESRLFRVPSSGRRGLQITAVASNKTGNSAETIELNKLGSWSSGSEVGLKVSNGCDFIPFNVDANIGPAMITVGIAMVIPYSKVFPKSA